MKKPKIREPNVLIEAKQRMSKDEAILWLWSLAHTRFHSDKDGRRVDDEIEEVKKKKEVIYAVTYIDLEALHQRFPDIITKDRLRYLKEVLKKMEKKIVFEVDLRRYLEILDYLGFGYLKEQLNIPDPIDEEVKYYGIATIMAVGLLRKGKVLQIVYTPHVAPLLLQLKKWFTTFEVAEVIRLESRHSIILYRLFKEKLGLNRPIFEIEAESLKELLGIEKVSTRDLYQKFLKPAVQELNEKTTLKVEYETIRRGRGGKIVGFRFVVSQKKPLPVGDAEKLKTVLEELVKSFQRAGENITLKKFIRELLSLVRLNPATAIWFMLQYPEGKPRLYAWENIKVIDKNFELKYPDKFLETLIKDRDKSLDWLLDQRTKDMIRDELKKILYPQKKKITPELKEAIEMEINRIRLAVHLLDYSQFEELLQRLGVEDLNDYVSELRETGNLEGLKKLRELIEGIRSSSEKKELTG